MRVSTDLGGGSVRKVGTARKREPRRCKQFSATVLGLVVAAKVVVRLGFRGMQRLRPRRLVVVVVGGDGGVAVVVNSPV